MTKPKGTRTATVTIEWADGEYPFRLAIRELRELQEKCDAGPQEIAMRLASGSWRVDDIRETIRIGLIGGGMAPAKALSLVKRYVDDRPKAEALHVAQAVILAAVVGVEDEPLGKRKAAKGKTISESPSPPSTEPEPSCSDGPQEKSIN